MASLESLVQKHFGVTRDFRETGYILSDGSMVDLSGRHYASGYVRRGGRFVPTGPDYLARNRAVDHRELPTEVRRHFPLADGSGGAAMIGFLAETGALRVMPGVGFSVVSMPTVEAVDAFVRGWEDYYEGDPVLIDILDPERGAALDSIELQDPSVEEIMAFLEDHFGSP